jgi:hypothetical protein
VVVTGFCFPPDVIVLEVRWYLRFGLSYRDIVELLTERGTESTTSRSTGRCCGSPPLLAEAARPCRHVVGDRWQVDETYLKVAGAVALRLPGDRPIGPGYRYVRLSAPRRDCSPPALRAGYRHDESHADQGHNRPGSGRIRRCSMTCCRRGGIAPTGTLTTASIATTAG